MGLAGLAILSSVLLLSFFSMARQASCKPRMAYESKSKPPDRRARSERHVAWWRRYLPFFKRVDADIKAIGVDPEQDQKKGRPIATKAGN